MTPNGILLIDKPKGITSFDVIRRLRRELGVRKIGHAGTLDPLASGLMIVGVGEGTKKLAQYLKLPKSYDAEIILGERRSTGDLEGEVLEECDALGVPKEVVEEALAGMVGTLHLPVPRFSAVKQGGQPLYKKARRGENVETPVKPMAVSSALLRSMEERGNHTHLFVSFDVGSGTYVRSLAEELGRRLSFPATLGNLRRTRIGDFTLTAAHKLEGEAY